MLVVQEMIDRAKALPKLQRKEILLAIPETELHYDLQELFQSLDPNCLVEVTHGSGELGKDLVIVRQDQLTNDVIAVVVKRGDIKGKTLGVVDEIVKEISSVLSKKGEHTLTEIQSQMRQAILHRAELQSFFPKLQVTKIFVVLCGELSKNARDRLQAEVNLPVEIFDLNRLIDHFTLNYPQVFFEGKSVDFLQELLQKLEKNHLFARNGKTFSECFVEPYVATIDTPVAMKDKRLAITTKKHRVQFSKLAELLKKKKKVLIIGGPGTGKTGTLTKLAIDSYKQSYEKLTIRGPGKPSLAIPILVKAKQITELASGAALIDAYFQTKEVQQRFAIDALLVDGLDEAPAEQRDAILIRAQEFSDQLSCSLVVTSRKIDAVNVPPRGYERFELLPFELNQALKLIENLLPNKMALPALRESLSRLSFDMPTNPLSLVLLVELVEEHQEIPSSVTELYDRFSDLVLGRMDREKGIVVLFEYIIKKRFLGSLAFNEFHKKNRIEIPKEDFELFVVRYAEKYGWEKDQLTEFLREMDRAGLFQINGTLMFSHRSFLDYFIAYYIFDRRAELTPINDKIIELYFSGMWHEVAFFYVGLCREIGESLLNGILSFTPTKNEGHFEKLLVGRLLQAGWHSQKQVKELGLDAGARQAPRVFDHLQISSEKNDFNSPKIVSDLVVMLLSEVSFSSMFLAKEVEKIIDKLIAEGTHSSLYSAVSLLWSSRRTLPAPYRVRAIEMFLAAMDKVRDGNPEMQTRLLILAKIISHDEVRLAQAIKRKLDKQITNLLRSAPAIVKAVLPPPKKGFR